MIYACSVSKDTGREVMSVRQEGYVAMCLTLYTDCHCMHYLHNRGGMYEMDSLCSFSSTRASFNKLCGKLAL